MIDGPPKNTFTASSTTSAIRRTLAPHHQPEALTALAQNRAVGDHRLQHRPLLQRIAFPIAPAVDDHEPTPGVGAVDVDIEMQRRKVAAGARGERIQ